MLTRFESTHTGSKIFFNLKVSVFLDMLFYVYLLQSDLDGTYYKGSTTNPIMRLEQHNSGYSTYTRSKRPWTLIYVEQLNTKTEMLNREKKLKRGNYIYIQQLINGDKNILQTFLK